MKRIVASIVALTVLTTCHAFAQERISLANGGFEAPSIAAGASVGDTPEAWFSFASTGKTKSGVTDRKKRSGMQALYFESQEEAGAYSGLAQKISVTPGHRYEFTVFAVNDSSDPLTGESYGQVSWEWLGADGQELGRTYGPSWNFNLSPIRWEKFLVADIAPEGTAFGQAVITFFSRDSEGFGKCYVDDAGVKDKGTP